MIFSNRCRSIFTNEQIKRAWLYETMLDLGTPVQGEHVPTPPTVSSQLNVSNINGLETVSWETSFVFSASLPWRSVSVVCPLSTPKLLSLFRAVTTALLLGKRSTTMSTTEAYERPLVTVIDHYGRYAMPMSGFAIEREHVKVPVPVVWFFFFLFFLF